MIKLWVLEYNPGRHPFFVGVGDETALKAEHALKFETKESALKFRDAAKVLWMYEPKEYEFDNENHQQGRFL